jgi:hypothetical protein
MPSATSLVLSTYLRRRLRQAKAMLARTTAEPERYQEAVLRDIVAANAETTYGREHGFASIRTVADFQRAVPINTYEKLRPYVDRIAEGSDPHALTADPVEMFTSTSGTTSKPKLIPVTASGRRAEGRVKEAWLAHLAADYPALVRGKWFYLFNKAEEYRTPSSLWAGSNAGLMYRTTNPVLKSRQAIPYEMCEVEDYESRYYVILRHIVAAEISLMACINPSSTLLLAELAQKHAEDLIRDIYTGDLRAGLALPEDQYHFWRARLAPDRDRARLLARLLADDGRLLPAKYWPGLEVMASWKGPGVQSFIDRCREWYGELPWRDVGYGSSEFRTGLVLSDDGSQNIPLPDNYFYEFVPEANREPYFAGDEPPLGLRDLELGQQYLIIQTGKHGLYRYDIEDIVEVNGFHGRTPTIHFVQKAKTVTSITGEKIYETQVIEAMDRVAARQPELKPAFFVAYCDREAANYKLCIEFEQLRPPEQLQELLSSFEQALGEVNIEYPYKRESLRLHEPEIFQLQPGDSLKLIQHIGRSSHQDNQAKIPRLSYDVDAHFELFGLARGVVHA